MKTYRNRGLAVVLACMATVSGIGLAHAGQKPLHAAIVAPALAGKVDGQRGNSDRYMWEVFTSSVRPAVTPGKAVFET